MQGNPVYLCPINYNHKINSRIGNSTQPFVEDLTTMIIMQHQCKRSCANSAVQEIETQYTIVQWSAEGRGRAKRFSALGGSGTEAECAEWVTGGGNGREHCQLPTVPRISHFHSPSLIFYFSISIAVLSAKISWRMHIVHCTRRHCLFFSLVTAAVNVSLHFTELRNWAGTRPRPLSLSSKVYDQSFIADPITNPMTLHQ